MSPEPHNQRAAGPAALALGLAGSALIPWFTHWAEVGVRGEGPEQVVATALPPVVVFLLFALVGAWNPLAKRFLPGLAFGTRELTLMASMWLFASVLSFSGGVPMLLHLIGNLNAPSVRSPLLERVGFFELTGFGRFLEVDQAKAYGFGAGDASTLLPPGAVPWGVWAAPLAFWLPVLALAVILAVSLVALCHRQWSEHEHLSYPLAEVIGSLVQAGDFPDRPALLPNRFFQAGFVVASLILVANGLHAWFPLFVEIPLSYAHYDLVSSFPFLSNYCGREAYSLFRGFFIPFVIALAVLLPSEISLTCWVGWILMVLGTGVHFLVTSQTLGPTETGAVHYGMYWALAAMLIFVGRTYYQQVLRYALTFRAPDEGISCGAVIACRVFLVSCAALVALLMAFGVPAGPAALVCATYALVVLLAARVTAEIGIPWLVNFSGMTTLFPLHFLGNAAVSAPGLAVLAVLSVILGKSMAYSPAAQSTTISQVASRSGGSRGWLVAAVAAAAVVAVAASAVTTIWSNSSFGSQRETAFQKAVTGPLADAAERIERASLAPSGGGIQPVSGFGGYFIGGATLIFLLAGMRLRFPWWPFHPLPLIFLNTWLMSRLYVSFLIGWLIKMALVKLAGGNFYLKAKPFFIGVIVGQLVWVFIWVIVAAVYQVVTGRQPPPSNLLL